MVENRIQTKEQLKEWIKYEMKRYGKTRYIARILHIGEKSILCQHQILLRKTEFFVNSGKRIRAILYRIRLRKLQNKYAMHVPINCCGKGLRIMHVGPLLINGNAVIGNNCVLHMNTAIVAGGKDDGVPTVGNDVVLCFGACLSGAIKVADFVVVGANAVVNKDVTESNIAVGGIPAKKISNNGSLAWKGMR